MQSAFVEAGKKPGAAIQRALRCTSAEHRQFDRRYCIARRKSRMKEHLVAAAIWPFVQAARGVSRETERAHRGIFVQREQPASRDGARQRTGDSGGTKTADHFLIHDRPPHRRADFIAAHRAQNEVAAARLLLLRERQQRRKNHDAQVAHRAGVHVLAHQPMPERCVRECRFGRRRVHRRSDHCRLSACRTRHANCLTTPRQIARLKSTREEIEQPDLDLRDHLRRELIHRQRARGANHATRETHFQPVSESFGTFTITACTCWICLPAILNISEIRIPPI